MDSKSSFPWALIIVLLAAVVAFWYFQKNDVPQEESNIQTILVDSPTQTQKEVKPEPSIGDMQTAAANLAIPDFSKDF